MHWGRAGLCSPNKLFASFYSMGQVWFVGVAYCLRQAQQTNPHGLCMVLVAGVLCFGTR